MFAGVMMLNSKQAVSSEYGKALCQNLSRQPDEDIVELDFEHAYIVQAKVGALTSYDGLSKHEPHAASLLSGEPLGPAGNIDGDHKLIDKELAEGSYPALRECRGAFCGASYSEAAGEPVLHLFSDKLGVRPIYYWCDEEMVVFSTALRVLEALPFVPKVRDDVGVAESIAFGYPLAERTQYVGINVLREAEIVSFSSDGISRACYWRWDQVPTQEISDKDALEKAYKLFADAINIRRRGDREVGAFLSGGMDSRAIVAMLHASGADIQAINFSPDRSQDQALARAYAEQIGVSFFAAPRNHSSKDGFRMALTRFVRDCIDRGEIKAERPNGLWSGDGGSVGLGNVHLDDKLLSLLRGGERGSAIKHLFQICQIGFPYRLLQPNDRKIVADLLRTGVENELDRLECADPGQAMFLFLMVNDQRKHLYDVYEDLDLHRLEYQLPFFDSNLLEFICGLPVDYRNNHRFYTDWFSVFPESTRLVPWQTYPGHVECPLPIPENLSYQWGRPKPQKLTTKIASRISSGIEALRLALDPAGLGPVPRSRLLALAGIQLLCIKDYSYAVKAAERYRLG
ncbi:asparagine synthase-related protein [Marinobacter confluentis]|uniref:asparagine synthase (glutamine-hydrolyzing) n=1 Tax=Marinobacter confluentis TaxID=1697557 RepID=A0A4Z1CBR6_9GAMM|nr:asparagine synthetase B family protein [Marinobacter confluentis]TGN41526.1 asparagine synthetase B family protein [Marinobacter confluentis]